MNETDPTRRDDDTELGGAEDQELDSTDLDFIADDSAPSTAGFDDPEISFGQWLHQITTGQESDTMLRFAPTTGNSWKSPTPTLGADTVSDQTSHPPLHADAGSTRTKLGSSYRHRHDLQDRRTR